MSADPKAMEALSELKRLYRAYVSLLELGRNRIISLGGSCDPVDVMEEGDPALRSARALLAGEGPVLSSGEDNSVAAGAGPFGLLPCKKLEPDR